METPARAACRAAAVAAAPPRPTRVRVAFVVAALAAGAGVAGWLADPRRRRRMARRARYAAGRWRGIRYRLIGGHPAEGVPDDVLADRVRSSLGTTLKRLDLPRVHVTVADKIAFLHGDVPTEDDAVALEAAALDVSGVEGVLSYLHVGLAPGDTRPSEASLVFQPSPALQRLVTAAGSAGLDDRAARPAVRAVLGAFLERLPEHRRAHLVAHLPADVRTLATPPRRHGHATKRARRLHDFLDVVVATDLVDVTASERVTGAVLTALRELVPEEVEATAAVLPRELRELWLGEPASS